MDNLVVLNKFPQEMKPLVRAYLQGFSSNARGGSWPVREACDYVALAVWDSLYGDLSEEQQNHIRAMTRKCSTLKILKKTRVKGGGLSWFLVPDDLYEGMTNYLNQNMTWGAHPNSLIRSKVIVGLGSDLDSHDKVVIHPKVATTICHEIVNALMEGKLGDDLVMVIQHKKSSEDRHRQIIWKG